MEHVFVDLPPDYGKVYLYDRHELTSSGKPKKYKQVLWGDFLWVDDVAPSDAEWTMIVWHPNNPEKRKELRIRTAHVVPKRPLEIIFVDVGQGDGSIMISPERGEDERIIVIDAGERDHMLEFLGERFGGYRKDLLFHAAVITHPDKDHYLGFLNIFGNDKVRFENIYHNGIVERPKLSGWDQVGGLTEDPQTSVDYLEELATDHADIEAIFAAPVDVPMGSGEKLFPQVMRTALDNGTFTRPGGGQGRVNIQMLSTEHGEIDADGLSWMPGFRHGGGRDYSIRVIGPVVETAPTGKKRLRRLSSYGKTKNGHSVLLKLRYGEFDILFGGDLNSVAEKFLLKHYTDTTRWPSSAAARKAMIDKAREVFECDVMKVCHHGATDVTDEFLEAVNPAAFVISSGDQEGHVHPRPDLLGRLGRVGRGDSPVLLSTELQRSTREKEDAKLVARLKGDIEKQLASVTEARGKRIAEAIEVLGGSNVLVDGAIYVKTDGQRLIAAFRTETGSELKKWFYFGYEMDGGELKLAKN
ncbi:ComEC/Rec2 family competence protein [Alteraurantiacibacter aquimixticola]|uniref:MBL fold metallo-hydrolase n=1 Tax=Alteraurantiacibacter aquimixticola TaxID=2489173 RepID=A0A4T3EWJ9_9SPHN|nr:hypothetical protein [Alteraurantiacibacter aquimixticola]TIX48926.1 hypothetical protein E5222_14395 [Alteraurantiacibacter aquimixticola]